MAKKKSSSIECLDMYEADDEGFIDGDICTGKAIASFSFGNNIILQNNEEVVPKQNVLNNIPVNIRPKTKFFNSTPRGITPPIDGESFSIKRGYQLRPSTLRKLNELKAKHPDVNAYLNTILDEAILHYYKYIINENGSFNNN